MLLNDFSISVRGKRSATWTDFKARAPVELNSGRGKMPHFLKWKINRNKINEDFLKIKITVQDNF